MQVAGSIAISVLLGGLYRKARSLTPPDFEASALEEVRALLAVSRRLSRDEPVSGHRHERWAGAIADDRGTLLQSDDDFLALIALEWPQAVVSSLPLPLLSLALARGRLTGLSVVVRTRCEAGLLFVAIRRRQDVDELSERELMVAIKLTEGFTQKEVAVLLSRSPETVRSHVKAIFRKLKITNAMALAVKIAPRL